MKAKKRDINVDDEVFAIDPCTCSRGNLKRKRCAVKPWAECTDAGKKKKEDRFWAEIKEIIKQVKNIFLYNM